MVIHGDVPAILSKLEAGFRKLLRDARLPLPVMNRPAGAYWVDCRWPDHRLTAELDSYQFHNSRHSWKQGWKREREARARGEEFRRYIWEDVFGHADETVRELRGLLRSPALVASPP